MSAKKTRLLLLAGALTLSVLLFTAPKKVPETNKKAQNDAEMVSFENAGIGIYLNMALKAVEPGQKVVLDKLLSQRKYDSLVLFWDRLKRPDLAAFYNEEASKMTNSIQSWLVAGNRYYNSVQFCQDKTELPVLFLCAMRCFDKALKLDPGNNEAKIMLASCYVEGSPDPMKGIGLLKEVERSDSMNVKLQLAFAFFSIKSGQTDKAITRFKKALNADSTYIEAYLHLADAYEQTGERGLCIEMLKKYAARTPDITEKIEVNKYIEELKTDK